MMYECKHFKIYELVPQQTYEDRGDKAWQLFDDRLLLFIDFLREKFGPITINDWWWGGDNQWRGLRIPNTPYYRTYSMHSHGKALDLIFRDTPAEEVRQWLDNNQERWMSATGLESITVEEGVSWLHIDLRNNTIGYNSFYP